MSAIYGIINKDGQPVDPAMLQKMRQALAHRIRDGYSEIISGDAAFGFCKLVSYPNQEKENLPLETADHFFTANAHLHNREELIGRLDDANQYVATPDSYLIYEAYKKWGADCVHHLDGEYVYAVWNKVSKQLFISTDHIGFKPVFYYDSPTQFIFCSEIKGIEAVKETENYFDENALIYHSFRQGNFAATFNKEIKALNGGNMLTVDSGRTTITKYWELRPAGKYNFTKDREWYDCLRQLFVEAVGKRMSFTRPTGVMLSGGLDSSAVACVLSGLLKEKNQPLYAFSSVPSGNAVTDKDEQGYMDIVSRHCGNIIHVKVSADGRGPYQGIEKAFSIDEVIPNHFFYMDQALLEAAAEKQIGTMYTGFGGDFWLSSKGMEVIYRLCSKTEFKKAFILTRQLARVQHKSFVRAAYENYFIYTRLYKLLKKLRPGIREKSYLQPDFLQSGSLTDMSFFMFQMKRLVDEGMVSREMGVFDNRNEHFGIGAANPCFDRKIVEFLADVPLHLFIEGGYQRSLFRHAMEGVLPTEVQWRMTKSPYVTDHFSRFSTDPEDSVLSAIGGENSPVLFFQQYFSPPGVRQSIRKASLTRDAGIRKILGYEICQLVITLASLQMLQEKKYRFNR